MVSQIYPFEKTGSFECSDPMLNSIWELGWRTLRVCAEDAYTDTPFRERALYAGDVLPEYAITLATTGDSRLLKRSIELFRDKDVYLLKNKQCKSTIDDYDLIPLELLRWYLERTNDIDFAQEMYPHYKAKLDTCQKYKKRIRSYRQ